MSKNGGQSSANYVYAHKWPLVSYPFQAAKGFLFCRSLYFTIKWVFPLTWKNKKNMNNGNDGCLFLVSMTRSRKLFIISVVKKIKNQLWCIPICNIYLNNEARCTLCVPKLSGTLYNVISWCTDNKPLLIALLSVCIVSFLHIYKCHTISG